MLDVERPPLPVPEVLAPLLPDGLRRGSVAAVLGSTSLLLALLAPASQRGSWVVVLGQPTFGALAAAEAGLTLSRVGVVTDPGADAALVLAALLDGVDVVVVGPAVRLTDADRHRIAARARERGTVLIPTSPWDGASTVLTVTDRRWAGIGPGSGRLKEQHLVVARTGRGRHAGAAVELTLTLPLSGSGEVATAPAATASDVPTQGRRLHLAG